MNKKPKSVEEKALNNSPNCYTGMVNPKREFIERADLMKLPSARLSKLLSLKKVPNRSKLTTKAKKIAALEGILTHGELNWLDGSISQESKEVKTTKVRPSPSKAGEGKRLQDPVSGLDVHEGKLSVAIATPEGIVDERTLINDFEGIEDLVKILTYNRVLFVGMESTAEYWQKACWKLSEAGFNVLVANPQQTKATQGQKTDKHDARRIALALRDGRLKASVVCTPDQYTRRKLSRFAIKKSQQGASAINRFKAMYSMFDAAKWIRTLHKSARGRNILIRCLELSDVEKIEKILTEEYAHGRRCIVKNPDILHKKTLEIVRFLSSMDQNSGNRIRFSQHLDEYISCRAVSSQFYLEILHLAANDTQFHKNLELLVSIPSLGERSAISTLVEIADINFFERSKSLAKWTGLTPRVSQSGFKKRQTGRLYKGGNKWLRKTIYYVASLDYAHLKKTGEEGHPIGTFIRRLITQEKKSKKTAIAAGARKLLSYVFHVLQQQRPFQEIFELQQVEQLERSRKRKLGALKRLIQLSSAAEILPIMVGELSAKNIDLNRTETLLAGELATLLGVTPKIYIDPPNL